MFTLLIIKDPVNRVYRNQTMSNTNTQKTPSKNRPVIAFRHSDKVKQKLIDKALQQNIDPANVFRNAFNAGLSSLYGWKIEGNEIVESKASTDTVSQ